jgi:hypothetical protein
VLDYADPVICAFEDMFLVNKDRMLKVQLNATVSEFKYNVTESQQTALGATYPYIKRNGSNYYRTFSVGGLITSLSDDESWYDPNFQNGEFIPKVK